MEGGSRGGWRKEGEGEVRAAAHCPFISSKTQRHVTAGRWHMSKTVIHFLKKNNK